MVVFTSLMFRSSADLRRAEEVLQAVCFIEGAADVPEKLLCSGEARSRCSGALKLTVQYTFLLSSWVFFVGAKIQLSASAGRGDTTKFTLLDQDLGKKCLAALLGVGDGRIRKNLAGAPDMRFGAREHRSAPGSWSVDSFLTIAYNSIAETLPDRLLDCIKLFS